MPDRLLLHRAILLVSGILLLLIPAYLFAADEVVSEKQLRQLNTRIKELEQSLNQVKGARTETFRALQKTEKSIASNTRKIRENQKQSQKLQKRLTGLKTRQRELRRKQNQQKAYLERQIRSAYAMGRQEYLKVLLNQQQPDQVSRVLRYYDYINKERSRHIDEYVSTSRDLHQVEKQILQEDYALQALLKRLENSRKKLEQEQANRETLVANLDQDIVDKGQELARLNQDRARLEKLLKEVREAIVNLPMPKDTRPFNSMRGKLPWPIKGPVAYAFGSARFQGKLRSNGILIRTDEGREIKAIHSGRVVFADWLRGYGVLMILDHGNGYMSLYGHNQALLREAGDWIHGGESIATAGRSGGQRRSGLYFEIRKKGAPQDPIIWLSRR